MSKCKKCGAPSHKCQREEIERLQREIARLKKTLTDTLVRAECAERNLQVYLESIQHFCKILVP